MIKRFIITLISSLCLFFPASANIKINPDTVGATIKEFFTEEKNAASALATYTAAVAEDGSISAQSLWNVCYAGGLDVKKAADKTKCSKFVTKMISSGTVRFYEVCGKDKGKSGGTEYCVDNFFTAKGMWQTLNGVNQVQVTLTPAIELAKEYARLKHNDTSLQCSSKYRKDGNDDILKCSSKNKNTYYEFVFDDLRESTDLDVQRGIILGVCHLHDLKAFMGGCPTCALKNGCMADSESACDKLRKSFSKFGSYIIKHNNGVCEADLSDVSDSDQLQTAYDIDNFTFCRGIQMQNAPTVDDALKEYIIAAAKKKGVSLTKTQITCKAGFRTYTGKGCKANGLTDWKDDIKTCTVGKEQIDFVFDDINELNKKRHEGGQQAMDCIVSGGNYRGKSCIVAGEETCNKVIAASARRCPECKSVYWDPDLQQCMLPASASVESLDKGLQVGLIVGTAAAAVAVTVVTGGAAGAGAVLLVVEVTGAAIETAATIKIQQLADEFFNESAVCNEPECAEVLVKKYLQRLSNVYNDLTDAEAPGIDQEMARLFEIIPETSDVYNGTRLKDNQKSMFDSGSWEPEQVWRAVGVGLQMAGLITSFVKWIAKTPKMAKTTTVITTKLQKALPVGKEMKALAAGSDDAMKALGAGSDDAMKALTAGGMKREHAKALQDIAERQAKNGGKLSKTDIYKREEIYNIYKDIYGGSDNIEMAGRSVMRAETISETEAKLAKAQENLKYAQEHTSQISRAERNARQAEVDRLTKQLSDLGVSYNPVEASRATTSVADDAARASNKASNVADEAAKATSATANNINKVDEAYKVGKTASTRAEILDKWGLRADASDAEIANRYKQLQRRFHPDKAGPDTVFADQLDEVFKDIGVEKDLLDKLPKVPVTETKGALNAGRGAQRALPAAEDGAKVVVKATEDIPMIGHNLIGAAAGARALGRLIDKENPAPLQGFGYDGEETPSVAPAIQNTTPGNNTTPDNNTTPGNNATPDNNTTPGLAPTVTPVITSVETPSTTPSSDNNRPTTFTPDKGKNTGLIVGLTALGLVATGAVVGGVVAATTKDKGASSSSSAAAGTQIDPELEALLNKASGNLGVVDQKQVSLVPLPTTVNTTAKIVTIDGYAVAVVAYDSFRLPYYVFNGKWRPLLGIGEKGRWFNIYPNANTGIKKLDNITSLLNQQLSPVIVSRYTGANAYGVSFPTASDKAFDIINAEFPNGVVQYKDMSVEDRKLYNDNYKMMQNKLK